MQTPQSMNVPYEPQHYAPEAQRRPAAPPAHGSTHGDYPNLASRRCRFRAFVLADIAQLVALAGEHRVADTTIGVPHPYTAQFARMWISSHAADWQERRAIHWAVQELAGEQLVGYAGLNRIDLQRRQGELRFWVGRGVERASLGIEWSEAIVDYAVHGLHLQRVYALQLVRHAAAGRVLKAIGMRREGLVRKRIDHEGIMEDVMCWAFLHDP